MMLYNVATFFTLEKVQLEVEVSMEIYLWLAGMLGVIFALSPEPIRSACRFWREGQWFTIPGMIRTGLHVGDLARMVAVFTYTHVLVPFLAYGLVRYGSGVASGTVSGWLLSFLSIATPLLMIAARQQYRRGMFARSRGVSNAPLSAWWSSLTVELYRMTMFAGGALFIGLAVIV